MEVTVPIFELTHAEYCL